MEGTDEMNQCIVVNGYAKVKNSGNLNMVDFLHSSADFLKTICLTKCLITISYRSYQTKSFTVMLKRNT